MIKPFDFSDYCILWFIKRPDLSLWFSKEWPRQKSNSSNHELRLYATQVKEGTAYILTLPGYEVGVHHGHAQLLHHAAHGALPRGDTPRQAHQEHCAYFWEAQHSIKTIKQAGGVNKVLYIAHTGAELDKTGRRCGLGPVYRSRRRRNI